MLLAIGCTAFNRAASFTASQTGPTTWVYDLTFAAWDNYSITQPATTITLNGLYGVTSAGGPTSTTFPNPTLNTLNLAWTSQVLNGGTTVVWTHNGGGTGNFGDLMSVFGFSVNASGATNGLAAFATSGISRDLGNPLPGGFNLDISGLLAAPVAVPEPGVLPLLAFGVILLRRRLGFSRAA